MASNFFEDNIGKVEITSRNDEGLPGEIISTSYQIPAYIKCLTR